MAQSESFRVAIAVATAGRPHVIAAMAPYFVNQSRPADVIVVSAADPADVAGLAEAFPGIEIIFGAKGLPAQRNAALRALKDRCDAVIFFDDDLLPSRFFVERTRAFLLANPDVAGVSGVLADDGIARGGVEFEEARAKVEAADAALPPLNAPTFPIRNMYGCNMVARMPAALTVGFDERLPLYAWQEDVDFSIRLRPHGRLVGTPALSGVHLGTRSGRTPGVRLGYSQIANPYYLVRKGTFPALDALQLAGRNMLANSGKALFPEPWVDRAGRLKGNLLALRDLMTGKIAPERVLEL